MNLGEQFRSAVVTALPTDSIRYVAGLMRDQSVGAVVVVDGAQEKKKVVGIVTDRDVAMRVAAGNVSTEAPVREIMTAKVITIWEDQGLFNATQYFLGHKIRRLPVIDRSNHLVGLVTFDDVLALLARELLNVAQAVAPALHSEPGIPSREGVFAAK